MIMPFDDYDIECPFCGHEYEYYFETCDQSKDCFDDGDTHEEECPECKKYFQVNTTGHYVYESEVVDAIPIKEFAEKNGLEIVVFDRKHKPVGDPIKYSAWFRECVSGHRIGMPQCGAGNGITPKAAIIDFTSKVSINHIEHYDDRGNKRWIKVPRLKGE